MSGNWIIDILQTALDFWNKFFKEIITLLTKSPETFKGGDIWKVVLQVNSTVKVIGLALLVLFFVAGVVKTCGSFTEIKRPEHVFKMFVRFALAKAVVTYGLDLMLALLKIVQGTIANILAKTSVAATTLAVPENIQTAIKSLSFLKGIPLWAVSIIGALIIMVLSIICILTVYGRFFKLYIYTAVSPIPLSSFAGEPTAGIGKTFLRSYAGVCMEGLIIVVACIIYGAFVKSGSLGMTASTAPVAKVWLYVCETVFNMIVLVGLIRGADRLSKDMLGL